MLWQQNKSQAHTALQLKNGVCVCVCVCVFTIFQLVHSKV